MDTLLERFLKYVKIDTQSDENSKTSPSTAKQCNLAKLLMQELQQLNLQEITLSEHCYLTATLPANTDKEIPVIGFLAHMDTSPDFTADGVNPQIIENYDGLDIILSKEKNIILSPNDFPELKNYKGQTLITTDGTTLLGADDKAGVAEIMTMLEYLNNNPEIEHGTIKVAFTPDEEIGRGTDHFDVKNFGANFAFTVDGGAIGELEYESFNAAMAVITVKGRNVHPGTAKNQMINSQHIAMEFNSLLPPIDRPEHTEKYEGFFHLLSFEGEVEQTTLKYIIRDHDKKRFEDRKQLMLNITNFINTKYGKNLINIELKDQYYNMGEIIKQHPEIIDLAQKAMRKAGVEPIVKPIRGGTDGSKLSFMGLPTPNLFTGGHNFHGKYEYIPLQSMQKAVEVLIEIIKSVA